MIFSVTNNPQCYPQTHSRRAVPRFSLRPEESALSSFQDCSWLVLPDASGRQDQVGLGAVVATGTAPSADLILVPSEGSSAENVTGGLAQARPSLFLQLPHDLLPETVDGARAG